MKKDETGHSGNSGKRLDRRDRLKNDFAPGDPPGASRLASGSPPSSRGSLARRGQARTRAGANLEP